MRSRVISREFWESEDIAELSHTQRLLFVGLWCMADREGLLLYKLKKISSEVFRYDAINKETTESHMKALSDQGLIEFGSQGENVITCIYIPKFKEYQSIHPHEAASKLVCNYMSLDVIKCHSSSTSTPASVSTSISAGDTRESGKPSVVLPPRSFKAVASAVLIILNDITGKNYGRTADIETCFKREKCTIDECSLIINHKWVQWAGTELQKNVNPTTPFRAKHFQAYLDEARAGDGHKVAPKAVKQLGKYGVAESNMEALRQVNKELGYEQESDGGIDWCGFGAERADEPGQNQALLGGAGRIGREPDIGCNEGGPEGMQVFPETSGDSGDSTEAEEGAGRAEGAARGAPDDEGAKAGGF